MKGRSAGNNSRTTPKHIKAGKRHFMMEIPESAAMQSIVMRGRKSGFQMVNLRT